VHAVNPALFHNSAFVFAYKKQRRGENSMRSILVPTDFSAASLNAIPVALEAALRDESQLSLMHAYQNSDMNMEPGYRDHAVSRMREMISSRDLRELPHRCYVREGRIGDCIAKHTQKEAVSLIVMGKNDKGRNMAGSALEIVLRSSAPVLMVPQSHQARPFSRILYVTDVAHGERESFRRMAEFAAKFNSHITYLYILTEKFKGDFTGHTADELVPSYHWNASCDFLIAGDLYSGLKKYLEDHHPDLIAVATHTESWIFKRQRLPVITLLLSQQEYPVLFLNKEREQGWLHLLTKKRKTNEMANEYSFIH
jgi:nucleotide-binding universal stress UspA family protein